jgi:hypothetical protein
MAAGAGGLIWTPDTLGVSLTQMTSTTAGTDFGSSASLTAPAYVAVDGGGNVWVPVGTSVSEFSSAGAILSPANGVGGSTVVGFSHSAGGLGSGHGVAIDPSGNVWIANYIAPSGTVLQGGVFELVGAGVPTVTPIALALHNTTLGNGHGVGQMP